MNRKNQIRERLDERKMSQIELAEQLGVGADRMNHWIQGRRLPDVYTCIRIARVLKSTVEKLWGVGVD